MADNVHSDISLISRDIFKDMHVYICIRSFPSFLPTSRRLLKYHVDVGIISHFCVSLELLFLTKLAGGDVPSHFLDLHSARNVFLAFAVYTAAASSLDLALPRATRDPVCTVTRAVVATIVAVYGDCDDECKGYATCGRARNNKKKERKKGRMSFYTRGTRYILFKILICNAPA